MSHTPTPEFGDQALTSLSIRELSVLRLCTQGLTTKEIAQQLLISPLTVRKHKQNCYKKLGLTCNKKIRQFISTLFLHQSGESTL